MMGVHLPELETRSVVDALIKTTLTGGWRVVPRAGWMSSPREAREARESSAPVPLTPADWWANWRGQHDDGHLDDHEPFLLTRRILSRAPDARRSD